MSGYASSSKSRRDSGQTLSSPGTASYAMMEPVTAVDTHSAVKVDWNSAARMTAMTINFGTEDENVFSLMQQNILQQQNGCVLPQPTKCIYAEDIPLTSTQTRVQRSARHPAHAMTWPPSPTTGQISATSTPLDLTTNHDKRQHGRNGSAESSHNSNFPDHHTNTAGAARCLNMPLTTLPFNTEQQQQYFQFQHLSPGPLGYIEADAMSAASLTAAQQACTAQHLTFTNQIKTAWLQLDIEALKRLSQDYWVVLCQTYYGTTLLESMPFRCLLVDTDLKLYKLIIDAMVPVPEIDDAYRALSDDDFSSMHLFLTTAMHSVPQMYRPLPISLQTPLICAFVAFCRTALERLELVFAVKCGLETLESSEHGIGIVIERLIKPKTADDVAEESDGGGNNNSEFASSRHAHQQQQKTPADWQQQHSESLRAVSVVCLVLIQREN